MEYWLEPVWFALKGVVLIQSQQFIFYAVHLHKCGTPTNYIDKIISVSTILLSLSSQSVQNTTNVSQYGIWLSESNSDLGRPAPTHRLVFSFIDVQVLTCQIMTWIFLSEISISTSECHFTIHFFISMTVMANHNHWKWISVNIIAID